VKMYKDHLAKKKIGMERLNQGLRPGNTSKSVQSRW